MIYGAPADLVARAIETGDSLSGTAGFAGELPDGRLVRDVLGRNPLFVDAETDQWSDRPQDLDDPVRLPPGTVYADGVTETVWSLPDPDPRSDEAALVEDLRAAIEQSLSDVDSSGLAVAFSGGVDSAVVASGVDAPRYVVGVEGCRDVDAARDAAREMSRDRDLRVCEITPADIEAAVPRVARAIYRTNAMDVSIALSLYLVGERAAADGYDRLAVGQGADELFGGYAKIAGAPGDDRVAADTVRGARREMVLTLPNQLERDVLALRAAGVEPVAPLLYDRVVRVALQLPGPLLVSESGERKVAFRRAARSFVPKSVATRGKTAVQYGSLVSRELDRLARQAGFKRRMDDHVTRYVESRLDE